MCAELCKHMCAGPGDDCGPCGSRTVLRTALNPGTYVIVIDGFAASMGAYHVVVSCPLVGGMWATTGNTQRAIIN